MKLRYGAVPFCRFLHPFVPGPCVDIWVTTVKNPSVFQKGAVNSYGAHNGFTCTYSHIFLLQHSKLYHELCLDTVINFISIFLYISVYPLSIITYPSHLPLSFSLFPSQQRHFKINRRVWIIYLTPTAFSRQYWLPEMDLCWIKCGVEDVHVCCFSKWMMQQLR